MTYNVRINNVINLNSKREYVSTSEEMAVFPSKESYQAFIRDIKRKEAEKIYSLIMDSSCEAIKEYINNLSNKQGDK